MSDTLRLLVVDDDATDLALLRLWLERRGGFVISTARSAEEALAQVGSAPVDIVITDIYLPGRSGVELISALREAVPSAQVIAITSMTSLTAAGECRRLGALGYVLKPFDDFAQLEASLITAVSVHEHWQRQLQELERRKLSEATGLRPVVPFPPASPS